MAPNTRPAPAVESPHKPSDFLLTVPPALTCRCRCLVLIIAGFVNTRQAPWLVTTSAATSRIISINSSSRAVCFAASIVSSEEIMLFKDHMDGQYGRV